MAATPYPIPVEELPEDVIEELHLYQEAPEAFFTEVLGRELWDKQREIVQSVVEFVETHVTSANGVGKTDVMAGFVLYWLLSRPDSIVVTTANTWFQVEQVLWSRIRSLIRTARIPLGVTALNTEITIDEEWYAVGISTRQPERFAGFHARGGTLVLVEEAVGLEAPIWTAIDGVLIGQNDRLACIGNPITKQTPWYGRVEAAKRDPEMNVIRIDAMDSPNVKAGYEVVPGLVSARAVKANLKRWGADDPRTAARIHGLFPETEGAGLFPLPWLQRAFQYTGPKLPGDRVAALDVARYGGDNNALAIRDGIHLQGLWSWGGISTAKTRGRALRVMDGKSPDPEDVGGLPGGKPTVFRVDADGLGAGVYDEIEEHRLHTFGRQEVALEEWHAGAASPDPTEYERFKDAAYWQFRVRLERGQVDLSALTTEQRDTIEEQALAIGWKPNKNGAKVVDSKEQVAKNGLKKSPDEIEALIFGYYDEGTYDVSEEDAASGAEVAKESHDAHRYADSWERYEAGLSDDPPIDEFATDEVYDPMGDLMAEDTIGGW